MDDFDCRAEKLKYDKSRMSSSVMDSQEHSQTDMPASLQLPPYHPTYLVLRPHLGYTLLMSYGTLSSSVAWSAALSCVP